MSAARSEAPTGGFSYAQAAKGQSASTPSTKPSSAGASGTITPATNPTSEPATSSSHDMDIAVTASTKPETASGSQPDEITRSGDKPTSDNIQSLNESNNSKVNDGASDSVDTSSSGDKTSKTDSSAQSTQATDGQENESESKESEEKPVKPIYTEAKPPAVNIWAQRAEAQKAKVGVQTSNSSAAATTPAKVNSDGPGGKFDPRRKSEQAFNRDIKKGDVPNRAQNDLSRGKFRRDGRPEEVEGARKPQVKPRDRANSELLPPSVSSDVAWPKPTDAHEDERKRGQDKDDKTIVNGAKAHGKTEWTRMPYTPTAIFETRIEGRGSGRMGKGVGKNGQPASARGPPPAGSVAAESQRNFNRGTDLSNGARVNGRNSIAKADRDATSPHSKASSETNSGERQEAHAQDESIQTQANGVIVSNETQEGGAIVQHDLSSNDVSSRRNKSPRRSEGSIKHIGGAGESNSVRAAGDAPTETNGAADGSRAPKLSIPERRADGQHFENGREGHGGFREGKRGGRKGGNRGGFNNGSFSSPNPYANGFQEFQGNPFPPSPSSTFYPTRGNGGNRGYRNQGGRSQSIPLDAFGRQMNGYGGYPMMPPMQNFVPEYYGGPYSAGPFSFPPSAEREFVTATVLNQIEYYFSVDNLLKDMFLRKQMDSQGWIYLEVVAQFNRLKQLTTDYDILKSACLQSTQVEIRVGEDGKDRLRKGHGWDQWVLPLEERAAAAQTEGPTNLRLPSPVRHQGFDPNLMSPQSPGSQQQGSGRRNEHSFHIQDGASAPFYPGMMDPRVGDFSPQGFEEVRGRQAKPTQQRDENHLTNGISSAEQDPSAEPDRFPSSQIENLTVVVRKHDVKSSRPPMHNANSRTFSNGSIDSRNIMEEVMQSQQHPTGNLTNGTSAEPHESENTPSPASPIIRNGEQDPDALTLFWVKDKEMPVNYHGLPSDTSHEFYTFLRSRALSQRQAAATGTCPYDLDVLYQFWSHFLIRNFNSQMYHEFKSLAADDASQRHNGTGLKNLVKYYNEALSSQINIRENIARDYAEMVKSESSKSEKFASSRLKDAWRSGSMNLKNRKKLADYLDETIRSDLEA
ncbi:hypothetical protein K461DRAFT_291643 [Myriangium duriaei CBS 260.36]|uniref:HTH La-type RNA-binding domain-containing protein n=1 Tax=Myriangium duriaei CBS 260.36 TaxID=1168546 RepID=A0A9P4MJ00_9PEZI|nr:hypothetical protein K461DRAFT_291643 [Myriangium duriaei CBS 260.36]